VAALYGEVLGRPVQVISLPPPVFRTLQFVMQPFATAASNIMGLNRLMSTVENPLGQQRTDEAPRCRSAAHRTRVPG
jgi:hypothetical protein